MSTFVVVQETAGTYLVHGAPHETREAALSAGYDALGSPDFYIATLDDGGRLVAYGRGMTDFGPDAGYDLAKISGPRWAEIWIRD